MYIYTTIQYDTIRYDTRHRRNCRFTQILSLYQNTSQPPKGLTRTSVYRVGQKPHTFVCVCIQHNMVAPGQRLPERTCEKAGNVESSHSGCEAKNVHDKSRHQL